MLQLRGLLLFALLLLAGCGRNGGKLAPVQGRVFHKGQPVAGGTIVFTPDPERGGTGQQSWARIGDDGTYYLQTEGRPGASPGWHRITVSAAQADKLPHHFRDPELSEQRFEVKASRTNVCDLNLD
ncbi:MAG: hypothetical protein U0840_28755 [Gemmataceae bacterium]